MPDPTVYEPTEGERFQIARVATMFALSMQAQAARRKQGRRNEQMIGGDHFAIFPNLDKDKSRVVYNMCFEVLETIMPILADLLPLDRLVNFIVNLFRKVIPNRALAAQPTAPAPPPAPSGSFSGMGRSDLYASLYT